MYLIVSLVLVTSGMSFPAFAQSPHRYYVAGVDNDSTFVQYYNSFRDAVVKNDSAKIASMILFPLRITYANKKSQLVNNKRLFLEKYQQIFTRRLRNLIINTAGDSLFANSEGIMLGRGQIWFFATTVKRKPAIRIVKIDDEEWMYRR